MLEIRRYYYFIKVLLDFLVLTIAFLVTRYYLFTFFDAPFINKGYLLMLAIILFSWYAISKILNVYDDPGARFFSNEFTILVKAVVAEFILICFILFFVDKEQNLPRLFVLIFTCSIFLLLSLEKFVLHYTIKNGKLLSNKNKRVVIVGAGQLGIHFYTTIVKNKTFGYTLAGFVDDRLKPHLNGQYLGKIDELEQIIAANNFEEIIIALPNTAAEKIEKAIFLSEKNAKRVRIIPDYYRFGSGNFRVGHLGNFPLVTVRSLPLDNFDNKIIKRALDLFFAVFFIVFFVSWIFPLIALIIKLNSKGPVFFKQERWGLNNKKIICYKFRSMKMQSSDLDEFGKYRQATKADTRITSVGKFLRKTSLDELPQLLNVLAGDMSFIGPRPHPIPLNIESKDVIQHYMLRHLVKPGITGWAQVNGARGETDTRAKMQKRINYDLWYIENWNIWFDFEIIAQTTVNMLKGDSQAF